MQEANHRPFIWMIDGDEPVQHCRDWQLVRQKAFWDIVFTRQDVQIFTTDESRFPVAAIDSTGKAFECSVHGETVTHNSFQQYQCTIEK
jgi:hypothetical protein